MFLEISQNSQGNTCAGVTFLIKLPFLDCNFMIKETLEQAFACEFCEISRNTFSYRTPPLAASERGIWFSERGLKDRERKRDLKSRAVDRNSIKKSCINAIK